MRHSDTIKELSGAMAKFQGAVEQPHRNRTVTVKSKTKDGRPYEYDFKYATFDHILSSVRDPMTKNGLSFMQIIGGDNGGLRLTTRIQHESGEFIEDDMPVLVGQDKSPQAIGSALTYTKRYALTAMLGLSAEEDDDGNAAAGNQVDVKGRGDSNTAAPAAPSPAPSNGGDDPAPWEAKQQMIIKSFNAVKNLGRLESVREVHDG